MNFDAFLPMKYGASSSASYRSSASRLSLSRNRGGLSLSARRNQLNESQRLSPTPEDQLSRHTHNESQRLSPAPEEIINITKPTRTTQVFRPPQVQPEEPTRVTNIAKPSTRTPQEPIPWAPIITVPQTPKEPPRMPNKVTEPPHVPKETRAINRVAEPFPIPKIVQAPRALSTSVQTAKIDDPPPKLVKPKRLGLAIRVPSNLLPPSSDRSSSGDSVKENTVAVRVPRQPIMAHVPFSTPEKLVPPVPLSPLKSPNHPRLRSPLKRPSSVKSKRSSIASSAPLESKGFCPTCQVPYSCINILPSVHSSTCVVPEDALECAAGKECRSTNHLHYRDFSHELLAEERALAGVDNSCDLSTDQEERLLNEDCDTPLLKHLGDRDEPPAKRCKTLSVHSEGDHLSKGQLDRSAGNWEDNPFFNPDVLEDSPEQDNPFLDPAVLGATSQEQTGGPVEASGGVQVHGGWVAELEVEVLQVEKTGGQQQEEQVEQLTKEQGETAVEELVEQGTEEEMEKVAEGEEAQEEQVERKETVATIPCTPGVCDMEKLAVSFTVRDQQGHEQEVTCVGGSSGWLETTSQGRIPMVSCRCQRSLQLVCDAQPGPSAKVQWASLMKRMATSTTSSSVSEKSSETASVTSSFSGRARAKCPYYKLIPNTKFAVDAFSYGAIPGVEVYFLTHFHSDHYMGLSGKWSKPIYCSAITARLVRSKLRVSPRLLRELEVEETTTVAGVTVTPLDANHCPGSLMLLFQLTDGTNHLHTGDFRATPSMESYSAFWNVNVHTLYLDTTYCNARYDFPTQEEVLHLIADKTVEHNSARSTKVLFVCGSYTIGKERAFLAIAEQLDAKIWALPPKLSVLRQLEDPRLSQRLTSTAREARVHVLPMGHIGMQSLQSYLREQKGAFTEIVAFRPSGWQFTGRGGATYKVERNSGVTIYSVPYSEHSGFSELQRFVKFLRPKRVVPTAQSKGCSWGQISAICKKWLRRDPTPTPLRQGSLNSWIKTPTK